MSDPTDLYRRARAAQAQAERGGLPLTSAALAAIAEMIALEAAAGAEPGLPPGRPGMARRVARPLAPQAGRGAPS